MKTSTEVSSPKKTPLPASEGTFPRRLRLRRSKDFRRIQRLGVRGHFESLVVILRPCRKGHGHLGLTVSKKVGNAVVRNLVKRRLRHILREQKTLFADHDLIVVCQPKASERSFLELKGDVASAHRAALLKLQKRKTKRKTKPRTNEAQNQRSSEPTKLRTN